MLSRGFTRIGDRDHFYSHAELGNSRVLQVKRVSLYSTVICHAALDNLPICDPFPLHRPEDLLLKLGIGLDPYTSTIVEQARNRCAKLTAPNRNSLLRLIAEALRINLTSLGNQAIVTNCETRLHWKFDMDRFLPANATEFIQFKCFAEFVCLVTSGKDRGLLGVLPFDLWVEMCKYLDVISVFRVGEVCAFLHTVTGDERVWKFRSGEGGGKIKYLSNFCSLR
jgi:hypothetical protein